jgi:hypothetical protein
MKIVNAEVREDDGAHPRTVLVDIQTMDGEMQIRPHGYGFGWPIVLEIVDGKLFLHVWNNGTKITSIDLETIKESN